MTPAGLERLKLDEGLSLKAYPDPLTKADPWTIGYGCTGSGINKDTVWTQEQADGAILGRVNLITMQLYKQLSFFSELSPVQRDVLINIAYNIGVAGLKKWTLTLAAMSCGNYKIAAQDIRDNKTWRNEVGERCDRCADAFEKGTWLT